MASAKTYIISFKLALVQELTHRAHFLFGVVRHFFTFAALVFIFSAVTNGVGSYTREQTLVYVVVSALVSSVVMAFASRQLADEITNGFLTNYLAKPVHYFLYWFARMCSTRLLLFMAGLIHLVLLSYLIGDTVKITYSVRSILQGTWLLIGGVILVQLIDFLLATAGFWAMRTHALQWFVTIIVQYLSGAFLPIDSLASPLKELLLLTPFPSLVYAPVRAYLGVMTSSEFAHAVGVQLLWIVVAVIALQFFWVRGTKSYECVGR